MRCVTHPSRLAVPGHPYCRACLDQHQARVRHWQGVSVVPRAWVPAPERVRPVVACHAPHDAMAEAYKCRRCGWWVVPRQQGW